MPVDIRHEAPGATAYYKRLHARKRRGHTVGKLPKVASKGHTKPHFVGVDGEGTGKSYDHKYVLLGVGDKQYENPAGIDWREAFEFLYSCFEDDPEAVYVGFFLGYDFSQILKTLPRERAEMLLTKRGMGARSRARSGGNHKPFPVRHNGWEFDMLPGRVLRLRPQLCNCHENGRDCIHPRLRWMHICDSGSFWQTSLLNVLDPAKWETPLCTPDEYAKVLAGKAQRADARLDDDMRFYNRLENELLSRAMSRLADGFAEIGVYLRRDQWYGPGQAAQAWMRDNGLPKREEIEAVVPDWFRDAAQGSYTAGWFELFSHGIIYGDTYEYDLNSAYPATIANLPCLLHGTYSRGEGRPNDARRTDYVLCNVTVTASNSRVAPLAHRTPDGKILHPRVTKGWHWLSEIRAAMGAGLVGEVKWHEFVSYSPCDCLPPARRVRNLYLRRLAVGKNSVLGIAAKLVYNSMYGKFAQVVGAAPFGNWIYASLITSGCRTKILEAIGSVGPEHVLMIATDGIFLDKPSMKLPVSDKLGEWSEQCRENMTLFKPGVYWDQAAREQIMAGKDVKFKARGISAKAFASKLRELDDIYMGWNSEEDIPGYPISVYNGDSVHAWAVLRWPEITFETGFSMVTALQAIERGNWAEAGHVEDSVIQRQSAMPYDKRCNPHFNKEDYRVDTKVRDLINIESSPYVRKEGMENPFSQVYKESLGTSMEDLNSGLFNEWVAMLRGASQWDSVTTADDG